MNFSVMEYEKFIGWVLDSILQSVFNLKFVEFRCSIKEKNLKLIGKQ